MGGHVDDAASYRFDDLIGRTFTSHAFTVGVRLSRSAVLTNKKHSTNWLTLSGRVGAHEASAIIGISSGEPCSIEPIPGGDYYDDRDDFYNDPYAAAIVIKFATDEPGFITGKPTRRWSDIMETLSAPTSTTAAPTANPTIVMDIRGRRVGAYLLLGASDDYYGTRPARTDDLAETVRPLVSMLIAAGAKPEKLVEVSSGLWEAINFVRQHGVHVVDAAGRPVRWTDPPTITLSASRRPNDRDGTVNVQVHFTFPDGAGSPDAVGAIGKPPHVICWRAGHVLNVAALPAGLEALTQPAVENSSVTVSDADLMHITAHRRLLIDAGVMINDPDEVLRKPVRDKVSRPVVVLAVTDGVHGGGQLEWRVRYVINKQTVDFDVPLDSDSDPYDVYYRYAEPDPMSKHRNPRAEKRLWSRVRPAMDRIVGAIPEWHRQLCTPPEDRPRGWYQRVFAPGLLLEDRLELGGPHLPVVGSMTHIALSMVQTVQLPTLAQLCTTVFPAVASKDLIIEVDDTVPTFQEARTAPQVQFDSPDIDGTGGWFDLTITVNIDGTLVDAADILAAVEAGDEIIVVGDGTYVPATHPVITQLAEVLAEARALGELLDGRRARRRSLNAALWKDMFMLGEVRPAMREWAELRTKLADPATILDTPIPSTVTAELLDYQRFGFARLAFLTDHGIGSILADDMGLGKTLQALTLIAHRVEHDAASRTLVIAPISAVPVWKAQASRFVPSLRLQTIVKNPNDSSTTSLSERISDAQVVVTSYGLIQHNQTLFSDGDRKWDLVICDEAQQLKNRATARYRGVAGLSRHATIALTGTPIENGLHNLESLLALTVPDMFATQHTFKRSFIVPIEKNNDMEAAASLQRKIQPVMLRRTAMQVHLDLPGLSGEDMHLPLTGEHLRAYQKLMITLQPKAFKLLDGHSPIGRGQVLEMLTALRRAAVSAGLVDESLAAVPSVKMDYLSTQIPIRVRSGDRVLVFCSVPRFLHDLSERLHTNGIAALLLEGSTPYTRRAEQVEQFQDGKYPVFLISTKAGGTALTLTAANRCYLVDPWYNPAVEDQAIARAYRIGQTHPVHYERLVATNTVDAGVVRLSDRKRGLIDAVIDDAHALFANARLTDDDLRELFTEPS